MAQPTTVPVFRSDDMNNLELVRQVVLARLKRQTAWNQFDYVWSNTEDYISFEKLELRRRFVVLANEVMWQLVMQGVITPGSDSSNPTLPFFRITDYGHEVLKAERFIAHDPTGYLSDLRAAAKTTLGQVAIGYVEEALRCFNAGCNLAAVLLLGVASESVFLELCAVIRVNLKNVNDQKAYDKLPEQIKPKHRWVVARYEALPSNVRRTQLPESLDITLTSLYELIRRQRNDLGHPQANLPIVNREQAFNFFHMFPGFVTDAEKFAEYCATNGI